MLDSEYERCYTPEGGASKHVTSPGDRVSGVVVKGYARKLTRALVSTLLVVWGGTLCAADSTDLLIGRLADEVTRDQARDKLRDQGTAAVGKLIETLKHANPTLRGESAFVLGRIGSKRAIVPLIAALEDKDAEVRRKTAYALGEIADARAIDALVNRLTDPEATVRANACFALGQIGKPKPARDLVRALIDKDETVRNYAAQALGSCGEPKALPALAWAAFNEKSPYVRALAISAMGTLKDTRACGVLVALLASEDYLVRARAIEALMDLTGSRRGFDPRASRTRRERALARWQTWYEQNGARLGAFKVEGPLRVYEWWYGKPRPKPEPQPEPEPGPAPRPEPGEELLGPARTSPATPVDPMKTRPADFSRTGLKVEAVAFFKSGQQHLDAGRHREAAEAFLACVKLVDDWQEAHYNLGLCYHGLERFKEAGEEFRRCLQVDPSDAAAANALADVSERLGHTDDAETFYRLALQADPKSAVVRFNLAGFLLRTGKAVQARPLYEELLKAEVTPSAGVTTELVKVRLAECLDAAGDSDGALKLLTEVPRTAKDAWVLHETARQLMKMGRHATVRSVLERAYEVSGGGAESAYLLAVFLLRTSDEKMRDVTRATVYAEAAVTADAADARYASVLAEAAHDAGDKVRAVALAENALRLAPESPTIRKQLEDYRKELAAEQETKPPEVEEEKTPATSEARET